MALAITIVIALVVIGYLSSELVNEKKQANKQYGKLIKHMIALQDQNALQSHPALRRILNDKSFVERCFSEICTEDKEDLKEVLFTVIFTVIVTLFIYYFIYAIALTITKLL